MIAESFLSVAKNANLTNVLDELREPNALLWQLDNKENVKIYKPKLLAPT